MAMRLSDEEYEEIKEQIVSLFSEYDIKCVPISSFEIATKLGIAIWPYSALGKERRRAARRISEDGFSIETEKHEWVIFYNDSKCYGRINNTIMHEIAHFWLGHIEETVKEEAEAKFFAKYALAPPPLIHNMCEEINAETIHDTFDISYEAALNAYKYYLKWKRKKCNDNVIDYAIYEKRMLKCFDIEEGGGQVECS